ncbi:MAG: tryptophan 2,3-dioxygenase [Candidatus Kapaibacterium sp.]|nr:MAG: tryptophan 2,3-dioxygenase [Candidatus Kapabacteria bacterium]
MAAYEPLYYGDYLRLPTILNAQDPRSGSSPREAAHDEMLFIITHQAYELWFKQILHELDSAISLFNHHVVPEHHVATALHRLERIHAIGPILFQQIDVLETMTPMDFLDFRNVLYPASGFQSVQFRLVEIKLGLRSEQRVSKHLPLSAEDKERIRAAEQEPTLFSVIEAWLERMPFIQKPSYSFWQEYKNAVAAMFEHDRNMIRLSSEAGLSVAERMQTEMLAQTDMNEQSFRAFFSEEEYNKLREQGQKRLSFKATQAALFTLLYREYPLLHLPFRLLDILSALDEVLSIWRYRHVQMVMRMIGMKVGTGGSSGYDYLMRATTQHRVFTDFSALSAFLIPRGSLPPLPEEVASMLDFVYIDLLEKRRKEALKRLAVQEVKAAFTERFPDAYFLSEEEHPDNTDGIWLQYSVPDTDTANEAKTFATQLSAEIAHKHSLPCMISAKAVYSL